MFPGGPAYHVGKTHISQKIGADSGIKVFAGTCDDRQACPQGIDSGRRGIIRKSVEEEVGQTMAGKVLRFVGQSFGKNQAGWVNISFLGLILQVLNQPVGLSWIGE